ncbi:MAG: protein kinase [Myxococcales bacterium]|nr:protein kinase [Myxococcales bacterium]
MAKKPGPRSATSIGHTVKPAAGHRRRSSLRDRGWFDSPDAGVPFGPYQLLQRVGDGGFAEVFLARPHDSNELVVVKRLHNHLANQKESVDMFLTEARVMAELSHPSIVQIRHFDQIEGRWCIVMDRVDGPDLAGMFDLAEEIGAPLPLAGCVRLIAEAAEALHYAHERKSKETGEPLNIIHRDIKPDNVLVNWQGDVTIIDFGCAKATVQSELTRPGIRKGTLDYMSPEQCLGKPLDRRTDIFSLGVVLYELVSMTRLYADASDAKVMERIAHEVTKPPSWVCDKVNGPLDLIVLRALEKRAEDRFETFSEMARALRWWLARYGTDEPKDAMSKWLDKHLRAPKLRRTAEDSGGAELALRAPSDFSEGQSEITREEPLDTTRLTALRNIVARRSNLAPDAEALIGRVDILKRIARSLTSSSQIAALHGASGVGKTHIADAYARERVGGAGGLYGGVWWVDASSATEVAEIPGLVAAVLELPGGEAEALVRDVAEALEVRGPTLIVLDGLDAVIDSIWLLLEHWITAAPELELLVTAANPLDGDGGRVVAIEVPPLTLPKDPRIVAQTDAGRLLTAAIRRRHPNFHITPRLSQPACDLLRELQGNPAAIELAAARLAAEDPAKALAALMAGGKARLVRGNLDDDTLASAVDWSWRQLDESHRACLAVSTVFHGGFDAEAANAIIGVATGERPPAELLEDLCERSLIEAWEPTEVPGARRYQVVRAVRTFARERLVEGKHGRAVRRAHAEYYLRLAEQLAKACHEAKGPEAVQRMRLEMPNVHAVLQRALRVSPATVSSATRAVSAAVQIWGYADVRGRYPDYVELLGRTLNVTSKVEIPVLLHVRALLRMCRASLECGDRESSRRAVELAQRAAQTEADPAIVGRIAEASGELCIADGHHAEAQEFLQIAIAQLAEAGAEREVARAYLALGRTTLVDARLETAESCMLTARDRFAAAGALHGEACALADLGRLFLRLERIDAGADSLRRAGAIFDAFGDRMRHAATLLSLATLYRSEGDFDAAKRCCQEAVGLARRHGDDALQARATAQLRSLDGHRKSRPMRRRDSWLTAAEK